MRTVKRGKEEGEGFKELVSWAILFSTSCTKLLNCSREFNFARCSIQVWLPWRDQRASTFFISNLCLKNKPMINFLAISRASSSEEALSILLISTLLWLVGCWREESSSIAWVRKFCKTVKKLFR